MSTLVAVALLPLVVALVVASLRDPIGIALPAYAVVLPFGQSIPTGLPGGFGSVSSLLGMVLGLALLTQLATNKRAVLRPPAVVPVWLAFLALAGVSIYWSIAPGLTGFRFTVLASLVLVFALVALVQIDRRQLTRVEDALLLGGLASACYGLLQLLVLGGLPTGETGTTGRFGNDLLGPNNQAAALLLPLAIAVGRIVLRSRGGLLLNGVSAVVIVISILMTGSRGGLLALAVTLVVLVVASPRGRRGAMVAWGVGSLALIVLILLMNPAGIGERQTRVGDGSGRELIWAVGLYACQTYCLAGSGYGTFPEVYADERSQVVEGGVLQRGTAYEAHNVWILVAIETGVLGLILVAGGLGLALRNAVRLPAMMRAPPLAAMAGVTFAGFFLSFIEYKFVWMALMYVVLCMSAAGTIDDRTSAAPTTVTA
jgi:O-antigen ligase